MLLQRGEYWKAVDLLAHTVVGVRETGWWLLWFNDLFVYLERKTKLAHCFKSTKLSELLRELGLKEGFMGEHLRYPAQNLIHELYGSYPSARRIHYLLKEQGWFEYPGRHILELYFNSRGGLTYLSLVDGETNTKLYSCEVRPGEHETRLRLVVLPGEHVDEENEETYFYRPAGLY